MDLKKIKIEELGLSSSTLKKLYQNNIFTIEDLSNFGSMKLSNVTYYSRSVLPEVIYKLESAGFDSGDIFDIKKRYKKKQIELLSLPLDMIEEDKFVVRELYHQGILRVKDFLNFEDRRIARLFYQKGKNGWAIANKMRKKLEEFGVSVSPTGKILFSAERLEKLPVCTEDNTPIVELGLSTRTKNALLSQCILSLGELKNLNKDYILSIPRLGEGSLKEIENVRE